MDLIIPSRNKAVEGSFPTAPKRVRQWLSELNPLVSANSTRTLIRGLKHCNRLDNSVRNRMEILDNFRPVIYELIDHAVAHYAAQNLPLSVKEYNSFQTVITLLRELAFGYKIVVADCMEGFIPGANKYRNQAILLSLDILNNLALRHLQVYQAVPAEIWQDCNKLYQIAESLKICKREFSKETNTTHNINTVEQLFICVHMLGLTEAYSLRRGQIMQLYEFLGRHSAQVKLIDSREDLKSDEHLYGVDLSRKAIASRLRFLNHENSAQVKMFILDTLIDTINSEISNTPNSVPALYESDVLTKESLIRFRQSLVTSNKRKYARRFCSKKIELIHGLKEIYAVFQYREPDYTSQQSGHNSEGLVLELEPDPDRLKDSPKAEFITHPALSNDTGEHTVWDSVAKGDIATTQQGNNSAEPAPLMTEHHNHWLLINASPDGLGLQWQADHSPHITVGEIVAYQDEKQFWFIGVVRWIRIDESQVFHCGIQHMAQQINPVIVETSKGSHHTITTQTESLMVYKLNDKPLPCIVVPAYMFRSGETVHIHHNKRVYHFKLLEKLDSTGSFSLFTINSVGSSMTAEGLEEQELMEYGLLNNGNRKHR